MSLDRWRRFIVSQSIFSAVIVDADVEFQRRTTVNSSLVRTTWHPLLRLIAESERVNAVRFSSTKWRTHSSKPPPSPKASLLFTAE
jgi:hypothetical protein